MFLPFESLSASESSVRPEDQWCTIVSGMDESKVITVFFLVVLPLFFFIVPLYVSSVVS